jgi:hypothetical protein
MEENKIVENQFVLIEKASAFEKTLNSMKIAPRKRTRDLTITLSKLEGTIKNYFNSLLDEHLAIRVFIMIDVEYGYMSGGQTHDEEELKTSFLPLYNPQEIGQLLLLFKEQLLEQKDSVLLRYPGFDLTRISAITLSAADYPIDDILSEPNDESSDADENDDPSEEEQETDDDEY